MLYIRNILLFISVNSIFSLGLNVAVGYTGLLSVGHAAFLAAGAYTTGLLLKTVQGPDGLVPVLPTYLGVFALSVVVAALLGALLAAPALRLRDDYFLMATLAFGEVVNDLLVASEWSGGSLGVRGVPGLRLGWGQLGWNLPRDVVVICVGLLVLLAAFWLCGRVERSSFGLALRTVAEDEGLSVTLGERTKWLKARALMISAGLSGAAGSLLAAHVSYLDPSFFGIQESVLVLAMVTVGGLGRRLGAIVGALVLSTLPDLLRFLEIPTHLDASVRQMIYGGLLILIMRLRPRGLAG